MTEPKKKPDLNDIRLDLDKQRLGVRVPWRGGGFLRIGRVRSLAYRTREAELLAALPDNATQQQIRSARNVALSELILLGWEDITDNGQPLPPWSQKEALRLLEDPELEHLHDFVWTTGASDLLFRKTVEDVQGN